MTSPGNLNQFIRAKRSESKDAQLPLKDLRVIDMGTIMAGPFAATLLGDFGAEVIKVGSPDVQDTIRSWGITENGIQPFWAVVNRNKLPLTVNLKSQDGKNIFLKLIEQSDVLIENMRPGTLEKLELSPDRLMKANPGLIIGRVSGYGQTGPYSKKPGFGTLAEGFSGFTFLNAQPDGLPTNPPLALADLLAGHNLAFAVMIALRDRERGKGGGRIIDISLYEPLFSLFAPDFLTYTLSGDVPQPKGNELSYVMPRNNYQTKDGKWVALSASAQKPFERMMHAVGKSELLEDPRYKNNENRVKDENRREINRIISEWIKRHNLDQVLETCERLGITIGPIMDMADILQDPQYIARQSWVEIDDPVTGCPLKMPNIPFRIQGAQGGVRFPGLPHGAANDVILQDLLGYSQEQVTEFRKKKVI